jgi:hypothetical protein
MYQRVNVVKPQGKSPGAAAPKEPNVTIVATDDIATWPARDLKGVNHTGNFTMKPGARMIQFYMTPSSIKAPVDSEGDEDAVAFKHKFEGEAPGNDLDLSEAVQNWVGVNCIIIHGSCSDNYRKVQGTKCAPLQLKASLQDDKDARKWKLSFEAFVSTGYLPGHYTGTLSFADPFAIVSSTAVPVNATNGYIYQLPSLAITAAIAFSEVGLNHGDLITLIGGGGAGPATLATGVTDKKALLKDGTTWVGLAGATINLEVFVNGGLTLLIEKSRT